MHPRFPIVAIEATAESAEALCDELFDLGAVGIEQRDEDTHPGELRRFPLSCAPEPEGSEGWPTLDVPWRDEDSAGPSLLPLEDVRERWARREGEPLPEILLVASFESRDAARAAASALRDRRSARAVALAELVGDEWRERYKRAFAPFSLTDSITVVPPWVDPPELAAGQRMLMLDPGRAFGTGLHPTTALVTEILEHRREALCGARLLDVGTGSGILALVALLHGAASVVAIDDDPDALEVAKSNAHRNALAERLHVQSTPLGRVGGCFDWVVANIEHRVLVSLAPALVHSLAPGGLLVLSGVLEPQVGALSEAIGVAGSGDLSVVDERSRSVGRDRWMALVFERARRSSPADPREPGSGRTR